MAQGNRFARRTRERARIEVEDEARQADWRRRFARTSVALIYFVAKAAYSLKPGSSCQIGTIESLESLVRTAGVEPAQPYGRGILSPLRLPVSPRPLFGALVSHFGAKKK